MPTLSEVQPVQGLEGEIKELTTDAQVPTTATSIVDQPQQPVEAEILNNLSKDQKQSFADEPVASQNPNIIASN